jgi:hypothetical protein
MGTRHAAALGLSEVSDALCLVVSEQKGTISAAQNGRWVPVDGPGALERLIASHMNALRQEAAPSAWPGLLWRNWRDKAFSVVLSFALWLVFVQGFKPELRTFEVPIQARNVPVDLRLKSLRPKKVTLTLSALKRDMDFLDPVRLKAFVNLEDQAAGIDRVTIFEENVRMPAGFRFVSADPPAVEVDLAAVAAPAAAARGRKR